MKKKKKQEKNIYAILGLGRFGYALAMELAASGADIIVLDRNEEKIRELREYTENAYVVHDLDKKTLMETGVGNCDIAIVCVGEHLDTSILTTLHLVSMGVPHVIAKSTSAEHGEILERLGAEVVYPEQDIAVRLAHRLEVSRVLDYIQLSERLNLSKLGVPEGIVGKTVKDADLRGRFGVNIVAIENGTELHETITPDYVFRGEDILYLAGSRENLNKITSDL